MKELRKKNTRNLAIWTLAWTLSIALATFGPKFLWENKILTVVGILISLLIGIGMILANRRFMNESDELEQKIQLESMGITLGLAVVFGLAYSLLDTTNAISSDAEISTLVIFIGITYIVATLINTKRFR